MPMQKLSWHQRDEFLRNARMLAKHHHCPLASLDASNFVEIAEALISEVDACAERIIKLEETRDELLEERDELKHQVEANELPDDPDDPDDDDEEDDEVEESK